MNRRDSLGLYVHIPFCAVKCYYCDFVAFSGKGAEVSRYLAALRRESRLQEGLVPETLYIGGGTPSELSAFDLDSLLRDLQATFGPLSELREATIEANPESTTPEKLDVMVLRGVGRVSFGLQATQDRLLKSIGRRHTYADFVEVFKAARVRGFSLNVDLMCGLPGQSEAESAESIAEVLALEPDHLSVYGLSVEDRTLFMKRSVRVDEDLSRKMLTDAYAQAKNAGFQHYEISNFARPGAESVHNINYWRNGPYIGLGCGAAGYLDSVRTQNEEGLAKYLAAVSAGERPVRYSERLTGKEALGETIWLGLRMLEGLVPSARMRWEFCREIEDLRARGLVEYVAGTLRLTEEGVFLANDVFREFVAPFAAPELQETA